MYEYICDHFIPGCTTTESGDSRQATLEKALIHLQEHHDIEHPDAGTLNAVNAAIVGIRI
jgi:predicted small metal-binding protein